MSARPDSDAATPRPVGPGTLLAGRYRLDDLLSEHGNARFYRGTDTVLARSVAINVIPSSDERAARLLDAARRSATVLEAHLLRVLDCDDADGVTWVVNEWGSGVSLDIMLERGPLPPSRAAWLALEVARTIAAAHDAGVCHGRLTPESVLVTHAGSVKLIGFAVSASLAHPAGPRHTGFGRLDERDCDVIDVASVLHAALTATWPGVSNSAVRKAPTDAHGPLRPRQVRAGVPRVLDAICQRVLRKEAHDHTLPIETAHEIAAALADFVGEEPVAPVDVPSMYVEPTVSLHPDELAALKAHLPADPGPSPLPPLPRPTPPPAADPEATQAMALGDVASVRPAPSSAPSSAESTGELVPVPPPFEDNPERPLFADSHRRKEVAGPAPVVPPPASHRPRHQRPEPELADDGERNWLSLAGWLGGIALLLVAMVIAFKMGVGTTPDTTGKQTATGSGATPTPIKPVSVADFDPEGSPSSENPEQVGNATDGNPDTGWRTSTYRGNSHLGGLKSGVGLLLDLGRDRSVSSLRVQLAGVPTSMEAWVAPAKTGAAPTSLAGLQKVSAFRATQETATLRFDHRVTTRYVVLWLTDLPAVSGGYRGEVRELSAAS